MLTRSIAFDRFGLPTEQKAFRGAERVCTFFAVAAVTVAVLDLAHIHSVESAAAFVQENSRLVTALPAQVRTGIEFVSVTQEEPSVTLAIPRDDVAAAPRSDAGVNATVAALAAARQEDAVEFAMQAPLAAAKSLLRVVVEQAPPAAFHPERFAFASVDPRALPEAMGPAPVSLPMLAAIPPGIVPMPRAAPGAPPPSPAQRLHLEGKDYAKAERCLSNAIYFEARSEPVRGQMAVAQVVLNRAFSGFYPNDICGVVYQNASRHLACQFTFACDGKSKAINERGAWARANRIAKETLDGQIYVPEVAKSTHYHAIYVHPNWVREMKKMVRYGLHNFYRPYAWGNGADEPTWGSGALADNKKK